MDILMSVVVGIRQYSYIADGLWGVVMYVSVRVFISLPPITPSQPPYKTTITLSMFLTKLTHSLKNKLTQTIQKWYAHNVNFTNSEMVFVIKT